jgi:hypothetical protein
MEACTSSLYQNNAFRVTGLHIHASTRNIKRRLDELKMAVELNELEDEFSHALALDPPPSIDQIRNAGQRLQDIQSRFIDEFFWFWPINWASADSDGALLALANGDRAKAENIWNDQLSGRHPDEVCVATHNLAVLFHILALDMEHLHLRSGPPMLPAQVAQMDSYWETSFKYWEKLVDHEPFWNLVSERVHAINDPGLSTGFLHRLRDGFPVAFDNINASLATALAKQGKHSRAALHIKFMQETHQGLDDTDATLQQITKPLHTRIDHAIQQATGNLRDDPKDGAHRAEQLLKVTAEPLKALSTLLGAKNSEAIEVGDEIAEAFFSCVIAYGNATEDWGICAILLEKGQPLASSSALQKRFIENKSIVQKNHEAKQLHELCWFCKKHTAVEGCKREVDVHQLANDLSSVVSRQIRWRHLKLPVPRCPSCKRKHIFMQVWIATALAGGAIGLFFEPLIGLGIGAGVGAVVGLFIGTKIRFIPAGCYKFPVVIESFSEGWKQGDQPPSVQGSPILIPMNLLGFVFLSIFLVGGSVFLFQAMGGAETWSGSSSSSSSASSYQSRTASASQPTYSSSYSSSRSALGREIESEKSRAKLMGTQIEEMDANIEALERTMNNYRYSNTDEYNRLVPRFNSMVKGRNEVHEEYKQLIDSVNAKVRQYNASR